MFDIQLRPLKDAILKPIAAAIGNRLSPNSISIIGFLCGLASAALVVADSLAVALTFWLLNRIVDGLDGVVARRSGSQSEFGGYLDIMLDFTIYAMIPLAFSLRSGQQGVWIAAGVMLAVFYINGASWMYLSALVASRPSADWQKDVEGGQGTSDHREHPGPSSDSKRSQTSVPMPTGVVEGTETLILFTLFFILPGLLSYLFLVLAAGTIAGVLQRLLWASRALKPPTAKDRGEHR